MELLVSEGKGEKGSEREKKVFLSVSFHFIYVPFFCSSIKRKVSFSSVSSPFPDTIIEPIAMSSKEN